MDTRMEKQVQIEEDKTKDPEILTEDLNSRGKRLQSTVRRLFLLHSSAASAARALSQRVTQCDDGKKSTRCLRHDDDRSFG